MLSQSICCSPSQSLAPQHLQAGAMELYTAQMRLARVIQSSSRLSLLWSSVDSTIVMTHWSASRPTLSADSSRCRTQQHDWYSVSVNLIISTMHSSASIGCECLKGLFSRSPCRLFRLSMAMPRSSCGSSHRSPTSRLDKDCGLVHPTIYSFLLSDCLLLDNINRSAFLLAGTRTWNELPVDVANSNCDF